MSVEFDSKERFTFNKIQPKVTNILGFMRVRGTTNAIFILRKQQEKYLQKKNTYFAFADLEKAFDHVSRNAPW